ncbi:msl6246 [Mesorhizobium japonicum MAFF 303099]|uniref:Msl6246 protein n=1 Tax=Mesorhizobium japonicum (strain LMG 29417 / CECT 9101 / MAFF 303099) TaxID=266835 RepID=Q989X5_RHILO|nr:msl6246 [Mesorhizobium japonicum MAFF 303099]
MLTGRTLDRQLELYGRKGVHHLCRQVRELAEINGRRHAPS